MTVRGRRGRANTARGRASSEAGREPADAEHRAAARTTVAELRAAGRAVLAGAEIEIDPREATLLLGWALGWSEAEVIARPERVVSRTDVDRYRSFLARRRASEPAAYLLGEREFFGRSFQVDRRVLIPRPETEHLVEAALELAERGPRRVVDVGCGSGCIALTLALERPELAICAVDRSLAAVSVARSNRRRHSLQSRVGLYAGDLVAAIAPGSVDLVVANLPYVDSGDRGSLSSEIRNYEPAIALYASQGGLAVIDQLLADARRVLAGSGTVLLEIGAGQVATLTEIASRQGLRVAGIHRDYGGIERVVELVFDGP